MSTSLFDGLPKERFGREQNGQIIGSGVEGDVSAVGGSAEDNDADHQSFPGKHGLEQTYGDDVSSADGG